MYLWPPGSCLQHWEKPLRGEKWAKSMADTPPILFLKDLLASVTHQPRYVGYNQWCRHMLLPVTGSQTPPRLPWRQERRPANILIEELAPHPPLSRGVPGDTPAVLPRMTALFQPVQSCCNEYNEKQKTNKNCNKNKTRRELIKNNGRTFLMTVSEELLDPCGWLELYLLKE